MNVNKNSLSTQIKKEIGHRVLLFFITFMLLILCLTIYDLTFSIKQLRLRINEQIKPIESFAINQAMIDNLNTVELKISGFNETNKTFQIEWNSKGNPSYQTITWNFPFYWTYDYPIGNIAGIQFGYFRLKGNFLSDETLLYDLLGRLSLLVIIAIFFYLILYPLTKKIPEKLFLEPINRFLDIISNTNHNEKMFSSLPIELELLESKILGLLNTAKEHAKNKTAIELGYLAARLAHDIRSPLAAMELSIESLARQHPSYNLEILTSGIQIVRDTANNVLERYYQNEQKSIACYNDGNKDCPILLFSIVELILSQKKHEWKNQPCTVNLLISNEAKISWINAAPNEIKRLLSNLLNNSYEAIHNKSLGKITVNLGLINSDVLLCIEDNGVGIPCEKITDVLNGISLKHCGKGFGLSQAKKYMEKLGGTLELFSVFSKGTKIQLNFPLIETI